MKLALGTAQFGFDYGINNSKGQVPLPEIEKILSYARQNDILTLDTASAYGTSEENLGRAKVELTEFKIITKTQPQLPANEIVASFKMSLEYLQLESIYGLLIHRAADLLSEEGSKVWDAVKSLRERGLVKKIGVSVYNVQQIEAILNQYKIDIIQLPINPFDQRLLETNLLQRLKNENIEIHARSLFLQGVLLMKLESLPSYFKPYREAFEKLHNLFNENNLSLLEGILSFAHLIPEIDMTVIGVTSLDELKEVTLAFDKAKAKKHLDFKSLAVSDEKVINPSLWTL